tara:strand:+ start:162 stop:344 length:183 start_codon:yes stop_codon:yes gene_type:complete
MIDPKEEIIMLEEEIEDAEFFDTTSVYSKNGTDHLLENDEISATEEAFMNGWEEAEEEEE